MDQTTLRNTAGDRLTSRRIGERDFGDVVAVNGLNLEIRQGRAVWVSRTKRASGKTEGHNQDSVRLGWSRPASDVIGQDCRGTRTLQSDARSVNAPYWQSARRK